MATVITTIYEDGVFKPLRKVNLKNHQRVQITINSIDKTTKDTIKERSIMELAGLGKEIWKGTDIENYIKEERNSWDRRIK